MSTILFFPLNSPGHINSSLGLADHLKSQYPHQFRTVFLLLGPPIGDSIQAHGHELVVLEELNEFQDFELEAGEELGEEEELAEEARKLGEGKERRRFPGALKWPQVVRRYRNIIRLEPVEACAKSMEVMERFMVDELVENHQNYKEAIEQIDPHLIVIDAYFVPPCIVKGHRPWVRLYSANPLQVMRPKLGLGLQPPAMVGASLLRDKAAREQLCREEPEKWEAMLNWWQQVNEILMEAAAKVTGPLEEFLQAEGCEPRELGQQAHDSPHLNLYMFPKVLDYDQDDDILVRPARWFRCSSLIRQMPFGGDLEEEVEKWSRRIREKMDEVGASELIYFSLGTIAGGDVELVQRYVDMFKEDPSRVYVVSKGVNGDRVNLDCDANNIIGDNYVPQTIILQLADLAIIHGGNNSVTECVHFGKPMLVLPVFADQLDNAQRIADLGLGRRLDVYTTGERELMKAIDETLNDKELVEEMKRIGEEMREAEDLDKAVLLVRELVQEGQLEEQLIEQCRSKRLNEIFVE